MKFFKKAALAAVAALGLTTAADAHTVHIGWVYETNGDVTFYAHNYHGTTVVGGLILGGTTYNFTSSTTTDGSYASREAVGIDYDGGFRTSRYTGNSDKWAQIVTVSGLTTGAYSIRTTNSSYIEAPYSSLARTVNLDPVSAVPLPAGAALLLTALGGFGIAARRRRNQA